MIAAVEVRDFQSIASTAVEFPRRESGGGITTIVGPSSTGKSALLRAVRAAVHNVTSAPVRVGARTFTVTLTTTDGSRVILERGPSHSTYRIITPDGEEKLYTKSSTSVPDDVSALLGMRTEDPDPHFTFQFDRPHLLAEPGSVAARVVGDLTNASVLSDAVREGARRRLRARQTAETRDGDVAEAKERLLRYAGLGAREAALARARETIVRASAMATEADEVTRLADEWEQAAIGLHTLRDNIRSTPDATPIMDEAQDLLRRAGLIGRLADQWAALEDDLQAQGTTASEALRDAEDLAEQYLHALHAMGRCPTCGQSTESLGA